MAFPARYHDGRTADVRAVQCDLTPAELVVTDPRSGEILDRWPAADVFAVPARENELRIGVLGRPYGARLAFETFEVVSEIRGRLPVLARRRRLETGRQVRTLALATGTLAAVILAYVVGVPLLAAQLVGLVPPSWEARLGDEAASQIEAALDIDPVAGVCDPDPRSLPNRAIARFANAVMAGAGSPFAAEIKVVRSDVVNAFALPGGHAYYFSGLLEKTGTPDEFAGVMAHELGHVVRRHGMQSLIANSATGLLIGFVLGDMTGLSVAGVLGSALIDSHFSREDETEADAFAAAAAGRVGFDAAGLPDLLDRIARDDAMSATFAFLSDHPLTAERRQVLAHLASGSTSVTTVFTAAEWRAIKTMCGPPKDG